MARPRAWMDRLRSQADLGMLPVALVVLLSVGLTFSITVWQFTLLVVVAALITAGARRRWAEDGSFFALHARTFAEIGSMTVVAYATGWGPALALVYVLPIADAIRLSGPGAARIAYDYALVGLAIGELAIQLEVAPSFVPATSAHGLAVLAALVLGAGTRRIRQADAARTAAKDEARAAAEAARAAEQTARAAEQMARAGEQRFRALLAGSRDVQLVLDAELVITNETASLGETGLATGAHRDMPLANLLHPEEAEDVISQLGHLATEAGGELRIDHRIAAQDGWRDVESSCVNLLEDPDVQGIVLSVRDVSERTALEQQLRHRAFHDTLTGLANRQLFRDRVTHAIARSRRRNEPFGVLFCDLDGFKQINDTLGHAAGDELLRIVAGRIQNAIRDVDTAARLGGDEFAVLIEDLRSNHDVGRVAQRILDELREPITLQDKPIPVSCSIGIATSDADNADDELITDGTERILRNADIAMYMAKGAGKDRYEIFEPGMHLAVVERLRLEQDMQYALDEGGFVLYYQPIVSLADSKITSVEALIRWEHPTRGLVSPGDFIPLAEETGLIIPMGAWVLKEACKQVAEWHERYPSNPPLHVSVNVSSKQLSHGDLIRDVDVALAISGLAPGALTLEITESDVLQDADRALEIFGELKKRGVRLSIDDFGTGYSSLAYLQRFPFDTLKIDRSFIQGLSSGTQSPALVRAIVDLGRSLKLETVAEGIEHDEQLKRFRELHVTHGQGFLFARPAPGPILEQLIRAAAPDPSTQRTEQLEAQWQERG